MLWRTDEVVSLRNARCIVSTGYIDDCVSMETNAVQSPSIIDLVEIVLSPKPLNVIFACECQRSKYKVEIGGGGD